MPWLCADCIEKHSAEIIELDRYVTADETHCENCGKNSKYARVYYTDGWWTKEIPAEQGIYEVVINDHVDIVRYYGKSIINENTMFALNDYAEHTYLLEAIDLWWSRQIKLHEPPKETAK